jgi:hypothetical protein
MMGIFPYGRSLGLMDKLKLRASKALGNFVTIPSLS